MTHYTKRALVPADLLTRLQLHEKLESAPMMNQFSTLENQMTDMMHSRMPSDAKFSYLQDMMRRYDKMKTQQTKPMPIDFIEPPEEKEEVGEGRDEQVLELLPKSRRSSAKLLLSYLKRNPHIEFNEQQELVYKGHRIPNSNYFDLMHDLVRDRKTAAEPIGFAELAEGLKLQNCPLEAIGNSVRRKYIQELDEAPAARNLQFNTPGPSTPQTARRRSATPRRSDRRVHQPRIFTRSGAQSQNQSGRGWTAL